MNDFQFHDFIDNFEDDDTDIIEDIGYLVKKISRIEKMCKERQDEVLSKFLNKTADEKEDNLNEEMKNNKCRDIVIYTGGGKKEDIPNFRAPPQDTKKEEPKKIDLEDTSEREEGPLDNLLKKIYRKVALKFHPDKNKSSKAKPIFKSATKAHEQKNLSKLLFILNTAENVTIKFTEDEKFIIDQEKEKLDKKLSDLKTSIFYKWDKMEQSVKDRYIDYLKKINNVS